MFYIVDSQKQVAGVKMAMETIRQQNMQSSILFMQQEHAKTLSGLHDEIHRLQKKCSGIAAVEQNF